jgi:hypothetical protein
MSVSASARGQASESKQVRVKVDMYVFPSDQVQGFLQKKGQFPLLKNSKPDCITNCTNPFLIYVLCASHILARSIQ